MNDTPNSDGTKYPKGHFTTKWLGIGIAIFAGIGIPLSVVTGNYAFMGIGPAIGVAIGLSVGQSIEKRYEKEGRIRPLTEAEIRQQKTLMKVGLALLIAGVLAFLLVLIGILN